MSDGKEIIMFCPEYWWDNKKGKIIQGKMDEIEKWGGQGRVVAEVSERLPKYGYHVSVLARLTKSKYSDCLGIYPRSYYRPENIVHYRPVEGVDVYGIPPCSDLGEKVQPRSGTLYINNPPDCIVTWDHVFTSINYIHDFNKKLEEKLNDIENTIIHGHDYFGAQFIYNIKTARKLPDSFCILSIHMSSDREEEEVKADERLQWELKGCKLADKVHVISKYQKEVIENKYNIRPKKLVYIPNGVNLEKFRPATDKEKTIDEEILKRYTLNQKTYVAFWGRIEPVKGISNLIKGFEKIAEKNPEYELVILGIPSNQEYYHNEILRKYGELPSNIKSRVKIFTEKLHEHELLALIRNASIGVFPSIKEAFGLVAIEAQACGLPVVVGNTGGLKENVIERKTGVLVDGNDPTSIADGLEYVIANRKMLAENTIPFAKKYSWDRIVERYVNELYNF